MKNKSKNQIILFYKKIRTFLNLFFISVLFFVGLGKNVYALDSNSEGVITDNYHDSSLNHYREKYFYDLDNKNPKIKKINESKINALIEFLNQQIQDLSASAKLNKKTNLILVHGWDNDRADKRANEAIDKSADTLAPFIFAKQRAEKLKSDYKKLSPNEIEESVETCLLFLAAGYTIYPSNIIDRLSNAVQSVWNSFFILNSKSTETADTEKFPEATNLYFQNHFLSSQEINQLKQKGIDISKIDPPNSAFWKNTDIASYDPENEIFDGNKYFPSKDIAVPEFYFERMGAGTIKFKTYWTDSNQRNKDGKPKKKNVSLRVGWEAFTTSVVNHFARMLGYPTNITTSRKKIKLILGDLNFETFLAQWKNVHGLQMGSPLSYIEKIPNENSVYLKNVILEATPDDDKYRKMGPFRMGDNGFSNRREYRGLMMYNALIALADQYEYQSRSDAYFDEKTGLWNPIFMISDTGWSLGLPSIGNVGNVNEFLPWFTYKKQDKIYILWLSLFDYRAWKNVTYSDAKWMARRIARISSRQIEKIFQNSNFKSFFFDQSNYEDPVTAIYINKIKLRINQMIKDFDLDQEGIPLHNTFTTEELKNKNPDYINQDGLLNERGDQIPDNNAKFLGNDFSLLQLVTINAINKFQNNLYALFDPSRYLNFSFSDVISNDSSSAVSNSNSSATSTKSQVGALSKVSPNEWSINLGYWDSNSSGHIKVISAPVFSANRSVKINQELGENQKRYLITDHLQISVPIGFNNDVLTTPVQIFKTFSWDYTYSVTSKKDVFTARFFEALNPFSIYEIKNKMSPGEQLNVTVSYGGSVGHTKLKIWDDLELQLAILGFGKFNTQKWYFAKNNSDMLEVAYQKTKQISFNQGFDLKALFRLALMWGAERQHQEYKIFKILPTDYETDNNKNNNKNNRSEAFDFKIQLDKAFSLALQKYDYSDLEKLINPVSIEKTEFNSHFDFSFFLWDYQTRQLAQNVQFNDRHFIVYNQSNQSDRAFDRLWTDKFLTKLNNEKSTIGEWTNPINFFARMWNEGKSKDISFEGEVDLKNKKWASMEMNLSFSILDQQCFKKEFESEFKKYFNDKIGDSNYISFQMPNELDVYPNLLGVMRWQLSYRALIKILEYASEFKNLDFLAPKPMPRGRDSRPTVDERFIVQKKSKNLLKKWAKNENSSMEEDPSLTTDWQAQAADLVYIVNQVIGSEGQRASKILSVVNKQDIWVITRIAGLLDISHPTFRRQHQQDYWAAEIGKSQGESFLKTLRRKKLIEPLLQQIND